nr:hypothetical protein GCM10020185_41440 [Pseudomonas brassicacearum subsp. brassicacearum]
MPFSGHTEFLAELTHTAQVVMMLATRGLRVALVTTHLPLRDIADAITAQRLERVTRILHADLQEKNSASPSHASSSVGSIPMPVKADTWAVKKSTSSNPPWSACAARAWTCVARCLPTLCLPQKYLEHCDAVLAMYHDQGLPVLKYKGFGAAVNVTLGLPIIRTSVDHGTALDLAGSGKIDTGSLQVALETAYQMAETHL